MAALLVQRDKRFIPVDITVYLPTPDKRFVAEIISPASGFGKKLKYFRLKQELRRDELAKRSGVSKTYLAVIEQKNRSNVSPFLIQKIADGLGVNPLKLLPHNGRLAKNSHFIDYLIPPDSIGSRIRNWRFRQGFTLQEFTKKVRLSKDCVWRYERNIVTPNKDMLSRIAKVLSVDVSELTNNNRRRK